MIAYGARRVKPQASWILLDNKKKAAIIRKNAMKETVARIQNF